MALTTSSTTNPNWSSDNSASDHDLLMDLNRQKAKIMVPAIIYTMILMFIGTLGNPLAIYIYGWKWSNTTTGHFLLWLACLDLTNCLVTMPTEVYIMVHFYYFPNGDFCRISRFITYLINNATVVVFISIAVDRYTRICHPHRQTCSVFSAKVACIVSIVVGLGVSWPVLVFYGKKKVPIPTQHNDRGYIFGVICEVREEMADTPYPMAFFVYLWFGFTISFLILLVLYIRIGKVMLRRRKEKEKKKRLSEEAAMMGNRDESGPGVNWTEVPTATNDFSTVSENNKINTATEPAPNVGLNTGDVEPNQTNTANEGENRVPVYRRVQRLTLFVWRGKKLVPLGSTMMLFAITAVFVLSFLPFLIIMMVRLKVGKSFYTSLSTGDEILVSIFSRSYLINNVANPIVYGMCNSQFRHKVEKCMRMTMRRRDSTGSGDDSKTVTWSV